MHIIIELCMSVEKLTGIINYSDKYGTSGLVVHTRRLQNVLRKTACTCRSAIDITNRSPNRLLTSPMASLFIWWTMKSTSMRSTPTMHPRRCRSWSTCFTLLYIYIFLNIYVPLTTVRGLLWDFITLGGCWAPVIYEFPGSSTLFNFVLQRVSRLLREKNLASFISFPPFIHSLHFAFLTT